ncbi:MAG TPA: alkaline phosphatase family protein [Chthoniobacterales bacterium]|nr:alkaline phosphatase family protein [Chthoniobacterales bacterium]
MGSDRTRFFLVIFSAAFFATTAVAAPEKHVVVVVWDGMRPDFVTEQNTPTLWKLAQSGVFFRNNHSVYPSATIVNGTAIVTGNYPNDDGILANHLYRADLDSRKSIDTENVQVVRKGDDVSAGKYVSVPTIAELLHARGDQTAIATAKTVGFLFDRNENLRHGQDIFAGQSVPPDGIKTLITSLGAFPPATKPAERDEWTTKALIDSLWKDGVPTFSLLWLSEPDDTEHKTAPGAPAALAAIKSSDENLARVLSALEKHNARSTTDVFVVSDHGFSTIAREIELPKILRAAGFDAVTEFNGEPKPGQIMLAGNGGTVLFYVIDHDAAITRRLVEFLQQTDFAGVIFTRQQMEGTFALDKAKIDNLHAPDVEMAFRWTEDKNPFGAPGMIDADWQRSAGKGTHATLSRFDMHNTLIAAGPDFANGLTSKLPSGNVDVTPTILSILGMKPPAEMDGRVLMEALKNGQNPKSETHTIEATKKFSGGIWRQRLTSSRVGTTVYLDEGNGEFGP